MKDIRQMVLQNQRNQLKHQYHKAILIALILIISIWIGWFIFNKIEQLQYSQDIREIQSQTLKNHYNADVLRLNRQAKDRMNPHKAQHGLSKTDIKTAQSQHRALQDNIVGSIFIPSVKITLPILKNDSALSLTIGAGEMKAGQSIGEKGNYALAGHNEGEKYPNLLFTNLHNLKVKQSIYVTDLKKVYQYRVSNIKYISEKDVFYIQDQDIKPQQSGITLITCDNQGTGTNGRLMIRGYLIHKRSYQAFRDKKNFSFDASKKIHHEN